MKLRVGNACWHAFHVQHAAVAMEAGFFAQEGINVEIVHAKINPKAISIKPPRRRTLRRSRHRGARHGRLRHRHHSRRPRAHALRRTRAGQRRSAHHRRLAQSVTRHVGGCARHQVDRKICAANGSATGTRAASPLCGTSSSCAKPKSIRTVMSTGRSATNTARCAKPGSLCSPVKPMRPLCRIHSCRSYLERGFNKLYDFVEDNKPHGRPDRVTVARKSFIERNPGTDQTLLESSIRAYQFMRIKENFPLFRAVEAKLRVNNPDEAERTRDLFPDDVDGRSFFPA